MIRPVRLLAALALIGLAVSGLAGASALQSPAARTPYDKAAVDRRSDEANRLFAAGRYDEAERIQRENLAILERTFGADHPDSLIITGNIGTILLGRGRYREAEPLLTRAARGLETARGPDDANLLALLNTLGSLYQHQGRSDRAEPLFARVLAARERLYGPEDSRTLNSRNSLGLLYRATGRLDEAEAELERVVAARRRLSGADDAQTLNAEINLGDLYTAQGRPGEAETLLLSVLERAERTLPTGHPMRLVALNNLGQIYQVQDRQSEAEPLLTRALAESEAVLGADHPTSFATRTNLATVLTLLDQPARAVPLLEQSLRASERTFGRTHKTTLAAADGLAMGYIFLRRYRDAERLLRRTTQARQRGLDADDPDRFESIYMLSSLYLAQERFAQSEAELQRVLDHYRRVLSPTSSRTMEVHSNLAMVRLFQPGRAALALEPARLLVAQARAHRGGGDRSAMADLRQAQNRATEREHYHFLAEAAWHRSRSQAAEADALRGEAFTALQDAMTGSANQAIARMAARRSADQVARRLGTLVREREQLNTSWIDNNERYLASFSLTGEEAGPARTALLAEQGGIERRMDAIDVTLRRDFPDYFALVRPDALTIAETQRLLGPDEAVLLVVPGMFGTHSIAVSRDGIAWSRSEQAAQNIERAVQRLRWDAGARVTATPDRLRELRAEGGEAGTRFRRTTAHALYRELVAPVAHVLAGKRRVYVAAGGALGSLPFSLLVASPPTGADDDPVALRATAWFADAHALVHVPSLQSLAALRRTAPERRRGQSFIGFGDPVLLGQATQRSDLGRTGAGVPALRRLANLPGTSTELERMRSAFAAPRRALFLRERATERAVRGADLSRVRVLAFATHGLTAGEVPGLSEPGLVLTPPARASAEDDGYLAASEVSTLRLDADWVILSACNTATGDGNDADGLGGLARAFFYAGARNLLASHWPVSDEVAPILTVRTIELERGGMPRAEAFQQAMREIRMDTRGDSAGSSWAHPYHWAPFVLIGDGGR